MSPLPSTGMDVTACLQLADGVPPGRAGVVLLGGAGVQGDRGHAFVLGDPAGVEEGDELVVDPDAELARDRDRRTARRQ